MLTSIFNMGEFSLAATAAAMLSALVLGIVIAGIYRIKGPCGGGFPVILAILPLLVQCLIMIVNGNLGTSVAVMGAFGLARFRSAPGTAREIGFVFFAMAVGLAAGLGFLTLAVLITAVTGAAVLLLDRTPLGSGETGERELRITIPEDLEYAGLFDDLFQAYAKTARLDRVKTTNMGTMYELTFLIALRDAGKEKEFIDQLRCRNGNLSIILGLAQRSRNEL